MTDTTTVPATPADHRRAWENAVAEAREYLAETVHKIHPGLSARTLLRYVLKYRAHLATLAEACVDLADDIAERTPCPATEATARSGAGHGPRQTLTSSPSTSTRGIGRQVDAMRSIASQRPRR